VPRSHRLSVNRRWRSKVAPLLVAVVTAITLLPAPSGVLAAAADSPCAPLPAFHASDFRDDDGEPADIDNPYFPLEPGTTFVYAGTKDGIRTRDVLNVTHVIKQIHIDGHTLHAVQIHDRVYVFDQKQHRLVLEEDTLDWYAQDRQGNVWYLGEKSISYPSRSTAGSWQAGVDGARPGIIMRASPRVGSRYMQEWAPMGQARDRAAVVSLNETVSVPYGSFKHVLKTRDGSCIEPSSTDDFKFFAPGVGNIKVRSLDGTEEQHLVSVKETDSEDD
jgi:hypothetical protein